MSSRIWLNAELVQRCFQMAWFLFPEKETALCILVGALLRLEVSLTRQDRRLKHSVESRNKVLLSEEHVLQRLLFRMSERPEKEQERTGEPWVPRFEDLLVRWFKHGIEISSDNS